MFTIKSIKFHFSSPNIHSHMDISNDVKFLGTLYFVIHVLLQHQPVLATKFVGIFQGSYMWGSFCRLTV